MPYHSNACNLFLLLKLCTDFLQTRSSIGGWANVAFKAIVRLRVLVRVTFTCTLCEALVSFDVGTEGKTKRLEPLVPSLRSEADRPPLSPILCHRRKPHVAEIIFQAHVCCIEREMKCDVRCTEQAGGKQSVLRVLFCCRVYVGCGFGLCRTSSTSRQIPCTEQQVKNRGLLSERH